MTLRPSELRAVAAEVATALVGRPVQKVVQPGRHEIVLAFPRAWLRVSVSPRAGRLQLESARPAGSGEAAPAFCMLLRKWLTGARLLAVEVVAGERACGLRFGRGGSELRLIVLLYGAGARIALTDGAGTLLGNLGPGRPGPIALPPPRPGEETPARFSGPAISPAIALHYATQARDDTAASSEAAARGEAGRQTERWRRLTGKLETELARVASADGGRREADLLLAHLAEVPRHTHEVTLPDDFNDGAPVLIRLDPALSPIENATRLYRRHQRMARGRATIEARLAEARRRLADAVALESVEVLPMLPAAPAPTGAPTRSRAGSLPSRPYRAYRSTSGALILVGKGADKNDQLTFQVARGNDLWLHARDTPGAHVVLPTGGRAEVDPEALLDAALLAIHHSPARGEVAADVTWTQRKHVRRVRGAPGRVTVAEAHTLRVRIEPERLRRLLDRRVDE